MKLIDILVEELPKCGGWDAKWHQCAQDGNGEVCFFTSGKIHFRCFFDTWSIPPDSVATHDGKARIEALLADDYAETIITREQYEAALAVKNDGWIEWGGGKHPPVSTNTVVDVKFKNGNVQSGYPAGEYSWEHEWTYSNIIAYRLHKPQEAEQAKADDEADLNECARQDAAPVWSGEGQPPVGCECEFMKHTLDAMPNWRRGIIKYVSEYTVVIVEALSHGEFVAHPRTCDFRPIRSEADKKREDALDAIYGAIASAERAHNRSDEADKVYEAIAAGKITGVKLED